MKPIRPTRSTMRGDSEMNYIALLFTIAFGVMLGNLSSNWVTAKVVEYQAAEAVKEIQRATSQQLRQSTQQIEANRANSAAAIAADEARTRERRRNDREGIRLAQTCDEWRRADAQLKSDTTRLEVDRHCGRLDRYVQTGALSGP